MNISDIEGYIENYALIKDNIFNNLTYYFKH